MDSATRWELCIIDGLFLRYGLIILSNNARTFVLKEIDRRNSQSITVNIIHELKLRKITTSEIIAKNPFQLVYRGASISLSRTHFKHICISSKCTDP